MDEPDAKLMIEGLFSKPFDEGEYITFLRNLFTGFEELTDPSGAGEFIITNDKIDEKFRKAVHSIKFLGVYNPQTTDPIILCIFQLNNKDHIDRSRNYVNDLVDWALTQGVPANIQHALVAFYVDNFDLWRISLIFHVRQFKTTPSGKSRPVILNNPTHRYSYIIGPGEPCFTAQKQLISLLVKGSPSFIDIRNTFNLEAVTDWFFQDYKAALRNLETEFLRQKPTINLKICHDSALQILNRFMVLYFIQKKGWIQNDPNYLIHLWNQFKAQRDDVKEPNEFYKNYIEALFFHAFNNKKDFSEYRLDKSILDQFKAMPYLNGGLFMKNELDANNFTIPNTIMEGLFSKLLEVYNFTIREDSPLDEIVAVDPEMLGKVYESLILEEERGKAGIFYTPRTEIDFMCRISVIEYLFRNLPSLPDLRPAIIAFVFNSAQKQDFASLIKKNNLWDPILKLLQEVSVVDPACGSGSFLVGMLTILAQLIQTVLNELGKTYDLYKIKKQIIGSSLYGVDIKPWAIQTAELRLWLQLVVENNYPVTELFDHPVLPNLNLNLRIGDSLVQDIGGVRLGLRQMQISKEVRDLLKEIKQQKIAYFQCDNIAIATPTATNSPSALSDALEPKKSKKKVKKSEIVASKVETVKATSTGTDIMAKVYTLYKRILTERIAALTEAMEKLKNIKTKVQKTLLTDETFVPDDILAQKQQIKKYQKEIDKLQLILTTLDPVKRPFVWEIDFAEIFGMKNGFDIVVGNPPYVRQENIAPQSFIGASPSTEEKKAYKARLKKSISYYFPMIEKFDMKSDLYVYFYFHGLNLLNANGTFCFITSNSWLDTEFGQTLQEFLLKYVPIYFIFDNNVRRSFTNADINTVISLFGAPQYLEQKTYDGGLAVKDITNPFLSMVENLTRFVMFRVPFQNLLSNQVYRDLWDLTLPKTAVTVIDAVKMRQESDAYRAIPITQKLLYDFSFSTKEPLPPDASGSHLAATTSPPSKVSKITKATKSSKSSKSLKSAKTESDEYKGKKWGAFFFRMPNILFQIMARNADAFQMLSKFIEFDYGTKPGLVDFFILPKTTPIEPEYLKDIFRSTKNLENYTLSAANIKNFVFKCDKSKTELTTLGHAHALEHINWGEAQFTRHKGKFTQTGTPYPQAKSVKSNMPWYNLSLKPAGDFLVPLLIRLKFFFAYNPEHFFDTNMFYHGKFNDTAHSTAYMGILNCTLTYLFLEIYGRHNIPGRFNIYGYDLIQLPAPNFALFDATDLANLSSLWQALSTQDVKVILAKQKPDSHATAPSSPGPSLPSVEELIAPESKDNDTDNGESDENGNAADDGNIDASDSVDLVDDQAEDQQRTSELGFFIDPVQDIRSQTPQPTPARRALDAFILHKLGFTDAEITEIYYTFGELVRERALKELSLPRSS